MTCALRTTTISVALPSEGDRSYDILIRDGVIDDVADGELPLPPASQTVIVTDANVARLYGKRLRAGLTRSGRKAEMLSLPPGEATKSVGTAWTLASRLSELGVDRRGMILALGGGVVGDLAGFVASIYKRGIGYVQLPTTLLSQVDSSIGGKTGVDAPWGKNQLGSFYQPLKVLTDPLALRTLPSKEMVNGMAEIIKCAVIASRRMFDKLSAMPRFDSGIPRDFIVEACRIKAAVVSRDEKERGERAVLNYGHTVGHAIEGSSNYRLNHGTCVILGMMAEGWISSRLGLLQEAEFERQSELLRKVWKSSRVKPPRLDRAALLKFALADKKTVSSTLHMSLPARLGRMHVAKDGSYSVPVPKEVFKQSIGYVLSALRAEGSS